MCVGLLVVNVTWRGKTYVGTLMDATRHHWAPPRLVVNSRVHSWSLCHFVDRSNNNSNNNMATLSMHASSTCTITSYS